MSTESDAHWPTAATLLGDQPRRDRRNVALVGVPTYATSLSPRSSTSTPNAVRAALQKFSTWSFTRGCDVSDFITLVDYGDVNAPDTLDGKRRLASVLRRIDPQCELTLLLGGDNAVTFSSLESLADGRLGEWGLITLDAHLDLRDGVSNGSPIQQLLVAGLPGSHIVQIGLADFSNSPYYAHRAREAGITLISRDQIRRNTLSEQIRRAVAIAGEGGRSIYIDVDLDVADRSVVPGCPAAAPGGLSAADLRDAVRQLAAVGHVRAMDFTEVDVERDSADQRTVRLVATLLLEASAGILDRTS